MKMFLVIALGVFLVLTALVGGSIYFVWPHLIPGMTAVAETSGENKVGPQESEKLVTAARERNARIKGMIRQLGLTQDRIATGQKSSVDEQHAILAKLVDEFDDADSENWQNPPDVKQVMLYVLSGGEPDVFQRFASSEAGSAKKSPLLDGIQNYVALKPEEARGHLEKISPFTLAPLLSGPFALAKASLYATDEAEKAMALLDIARLSSPHTAIEEAALRRQIPLLLARKELWRALRLTADYVTRFGNSAYADGFYDVVARGLAGADVSDGVQTVTSLSQAIDASDLLPRAKVLLALARASLELGRLDAAKAAAEAVRRLDGVAAEQVSRAVLYIAAAEAPTERAAAVASSLNAVSSLLSADDAELLAAAKLIATSVVARSETISDRPKEPSAAGDAKPSPALSRAETLLKESEELTKARLP
ncbi:MAG: hypothetical protein ABL907_20175 [Hyphomicrobium sp.]